MTFDADAVEAVGRVMPVLSIVTAIWPVWRGWFGIQELLTGEVRGDVVRFRLDAIEISFHGVPPFSKSPVAECCANLSSK